MDKQTLVRDMKQHIGGAAFINHSQLAKYLKRSRQAMPEILCGLDFLETGREKRYFIPDVAQRLIDNRRI